MRIVYSKSRRIDHLLGLFLAIGYLAVLLGTAYNLGYSRDEGFYFRAARDYQGWFSVLDENPQKAMEPRSINKYWSYNHEHPALMKTLFGFSDRFFNKKWKIMSPSTALRFPGMITAALAVYLIFLWGSFSFGRRAGFFAAAAFALMPRVFYHAHLCCFDVAITTFWLLVTYFYWRSLSSVRFGIVAGIAFGLALCVKLNAFFLPFVLVLHYFILLIFRRRKGLRNGGPKPWAFVFGIVFAPAIFFAHWPWIWHNTLNRIGFYMGFHSNHPHYNTAYFGENIIQAPTPVSLPLVMTLFTVPTVIMLLFIAGSFLRLRHHIPARFENKLSVLWRKTGPDSKDGLDLLLFMSAGFSIVLISLPFVPIFGGTKHWMPSMPFVAILAGVAAARLVDVVADIIPKIPIAVTTALTLALLVAAPLQQTIASHPMGLASYVPLIGGARGAADMGMLRQFWGYTTAGVLPYIRENVGKKKSVYFHDTSAPSVRMFREEGTLRADIQSTGSIGRSDWALIHHELHMIRQESWIWNNYKTIAPVHVLKYQGVPIVSVYRRHHDE